MGLFSKKKKEATVPETIAEEIAETPETESSELIAVITAAIAAYEAEQYRQTLYIQKINRTYNVRPAWGVMGTHETIDARRM